MRRYFLTTALVVVIASLLVADRACGFCETPPPPKDHLRLQENVTNRIRTFSGLKPIASQADAMLSKLLSAKSPVIMGWIEKRDLATKADDEIVREWREYYARNFILNRYPQADAPVNAAIETLFKDVNDAFATPAFRAKMSSLFEKSKEAALSVLAKQPLQDAQKKAIVARVGAVQLYWMKEFKSSKFKAQPLEFLDWGIAYDPVANEINMGVNALSYPNDETYLAVFAHELGHAFDSCRWGAFFEGAWPFQKVGECLRGKDSAGALKRDDSQLEVLQRQGKLSSDLAAGLRQNPTCNKAEYPPIGTQAEQLPESFADWFSAETMASMESLNLLQMRLDLCVLRELVAGSSYAENRKRLDQIYFAHPKLRPGRSDLKSKPVVYCAI